MNSDARQWRKGKMMMDAGSRFGPFRLVAAIGYPAPIPLQPDDQARIADRDTVELRWEWDGTLKEDEYFDVRVWREEQDHLGVAWTKERYYFLRIPSLEQRLAEPDRAGTYYWAVVVLSGADGKVVKDLGPESTARRFSWEKCTPD